MRYRCGFIVTDSAADLSGGASAFALLQDHFQDHEEDDRVDQQDQAGRTYTNRSDGSGGFPKIPGRLFSDCPTYRPS